MAFFPSIDQSLLAVGECNMSGSVPIGVADSNAVEMEAGLPIPGNDDSLYCINFFVILFVLSL
jgi:ribosomal protein S2